MAGTGNTSRSISPETRQSYQALIDMTLTQYANQQNPVREIAQATTPKKVKKTETDKIYRSSKNGKASIAKRIAKIKKEKEKQPIIQVSDKTIISVSTRRLTTKLNAHPANVQYDQMTRDVYPKYKEETDKKAKQEIIHELITQIEGMGLKFIVITDPQADKGRELLENGKYRKICKVLKKIEVKDNKISHNQSFVPNQTERDTDNGGGKMSRSELDTAAILAAMKRKRSDPESS